MPMMPFACVLTLVAALGGAACANAQSAQPPPVAAGSDPQQVVATVGDQKITMEDVEARWQKDDPAERARVTQLLYQHRRQSIDQIVGDVLIDAAAKKAGVGREKYLEDQLSKRRGEIGEAEIKKVYDENRERVGASTLEDLRASITAFIGRNRDAQNLAAPGRRAQGGGAAGERRARSAALPGGDRRPRPEPRAGRRAGDGGRVLGIPVPVLRSRLAHAEAAVRESTGPRYGSSSRTSRCPTTSRRPRPPKPRTAPAIRANTGSCTTGCSPTSSSCRSPS